MKRELISALVGLSMATAASADDAAIRQAVTKLVPGAKIESIKPSAVADFSEVNVGGRFVYVSHDGTHLFQGPLLDLSRQVNLTEQSQVALRKDLLATVPAKQAIRFEGQNAKHHVTVFTDIDCGYCRKLHQHVAEFNAAGITVDYLFFPRGGLQSPSYDKAVSVWCAADQQQALSLAKAGQSISNKMCANPIRDDFELGLKLGVGDFGTPAVFADDGRQLGGYLNAADLVKRLNEPAAARTAR
ncbi:hypothetical protein C7S18_00770 [Ahniella affigens]|uniref:Thiol:disulfide interchange protein n=1 Tax=Ahniella affigens TaxID=2021234 RepID=A0A2P1PLV4_9GAMM|nr:DsbC family protein [Ahniella affigens]AVP95820.1 hypothetical protein C7S18_00770 [Ahniella affigens]